MRAKLTINIVPSTSSCCIYANRSNAFKLQIKPRGKQVAEFQFNIDRIDVWSKSMLFALAYGNYFKFIYPQWLLQFE